MINLNVYNSRTNVNRGLSKSTRAKNIVAQKKREQNDKAKIDKSGAEILLDIYGPKSIDMKDPNGYYLMNSGYTIKSKGGLGKLESKELTELVNYMFDNGVFQQLAQSTTTPSEIMERAVDLNEKLFASTAQKTKTFSSISDLRASYDYLNKVRENKGKLFIFDTETIGGKNRTNIWNPLAITEFAMQEYDYETNKTISTNIVMGLADNEENNRVYKEIHDYMVAGNWQAIEQNEELAVTAHRIALYADSEMEFDKNLGYYKITRLGDGDNWKNIKNFETGWQKLRNAYDSTEISSTGLRKSDLAFFSSISKMQTHLNYGNAMAVGQNFQVFDEPVINMQLKRTFQYYQEILDDQKGLLGAARGINKQQARQAIDYMQSQLDFIGGGLNLPNHQTLDTLPFFKVGLDTFGANTLMNGNREVIKKAGGGLAKQEYIGEAWFPDLFSDAMAHMADFDVTVLNYALTHGIEQTGGVPLIDYVATKMGKEGTGILGIDDKAKKIKAGQTYYAQAGAMSFDFDGRNPLNFSYNNKTGEIFTNAGYNFVDGKSMGYSHNNFNMGSDISKGNFYTLQSVKKINADELPSNLGKVIPNMSGTNFIVAQFKMALPEGVTDSGMEDITYNVLFNSEKQFSGYMSSSMKMALDIDEDGKQHIVEGMEDLFDRMVQNPYVEDELISEMDLARLMEVPINEQYAINQTLSHSLDKFQTTKAYNAITEYDNSQKNIQKLLNAKHMLDKQDVKNLTKSEFNDLLNGKKIRNLSQEKADELSSKLVSIFGFKNFKNENKITLYSNTRRNYVNAWEFVSNKDAFYTTVLKNLDEVAKEKSWNNEQRSLAFRDLVETMRVQAAEIISTGDTVQDKQRITSKKKVIPSTRDLKSTYDIKIPQNFLIDTSSQVMNIDSFSSSEYRDILRLNLNNANEHFALISKLRHAMYGEREPLASTDTLDRTAMTRFITNVLDKDKNFKGRMNDLKKITSEENYNVAEAAIEVLRIMKDDIKKEDPLIGILREIDLPTLSDDVLDDVLNSADFLDTIAHNARHNIVTPINTRGLLGNGKKGMREFVNNNVMKFYMPDKEVFDKTLQGLTDNQKLVKTTLYDKLYEDISNQLVDIFSIGTQIDGGEMSISSDGDIIFARHGKAVNIKGVPKVELNNGHLYGMIGNQKLNLHLNVGYNKNGYGYIKTNLGDIFENTRYASNRVRRKLETGEFQISDFLNITNKLADELREEAMYSGTSGELMSNYFLGTKELNKLFYDIFGTVNVDDGVGNDFINTLNIPDNIKAKMKKAYGDKILNMTKDDDWTEMDPALRQELGPYRVNIMRELAKAKNASNAEFEKFFSLIDSANYSTKDKSKAGKDILFIGGGRFHVGFTNALDENSRPVIGGAGNVFYLPEENIQEAAEKFTGILTDGALFESDETRYINKVTKDVLGNGSTTFTGRTAYVGEIGIRTIIENNFDRVMNDNTIGAGLGEKKEKIYNYLNSFVNTFEQAKVFSAEAFDTITGGTMAADKQKLTLSKDLAGAIDLEDPLVKEKFDRLYSVKGKIIRADDGTLAYVSANGQIVKHGDAIVPYASYGGTTKNWVSKLQKGVLTYDVTDLENRSLSDKQISSLLNKYSDLFNGIDIKDESLTNTIFEKILRKENLSGNFVIEDINKTTLPKILINDAEKSMNHLGYMRIGTLNENIEGVLTAYGDETKALIGTAVPTEKALRAYFDNKEKTKTVLDAFGFDSMESFIEAVKEESYAADRILFGKGGIFEGFVAVGNDNLLGHKNKGSMMTGAVNEAVEMLGKYLNNGIESTESRKKGLEKFVEIANSDEKFKIFKDSKGVGYDFELKNGALFIKGGQELNQGLHDADVLDAEALGNLLEYIDDYNKTNYKGEIPLNDRLVHKTFDESGKEIKEKRIIGRMFHSNDEKEGAIGSAGMKIVIESEKQSGMNAEYVEVKQQIQQLKSEKELLHANAKDRALTDNELLRSMSLDDQIQFLENKALDLTETGHLFEFGDRERSIMGQAIINKDVLDHAQLEGMNNEAIRGVNLEDYAEDKQIFGWLENELTGQAYYNRYEEQLLTKNMLEQEEYSHLKDVYEDIVEKRGKNLGTKSAENIYGIRMVDMANKFNNNIGSPNPQNLIDAGFEVMTPMQYYESFSNIGIDSDNAVVKRNVLIDLGEEFETMDGWTKGRYVAIPGMGATVGDTDIKKAWHSEARKLVGYYNQEYSNLHGLEDKDVIENLAKKVDSVAASTGTYTKKKDLLDKRSTRKIYAAMDRTKLMSLPDHANPLLEQAMVHGKSLAAWREQGVYYDAVFDSEEQFRKRGFFDKPTLEKFGMKDEEEMRQYLKTHGATMIDDRYPNIRETSLTTARHYLMDSDYMHATNAAYTTKETMLKILGDSDGDSASRFLLEYKGVSHAQYEHARIEAIKSATLKPFKDDNEREAYIKEQVMKTGIDEETYQNFRDVDLYSVAEAKTTNALYNERVKNTNWEDYEKTKKAQSAMYDGKYTIAEYAEGQSILSRQKLVALNYDPTFDDVNKNIKEVDDMFKILEKNVDVIQDNTLKTEVQELLSKHVTISDYEKEVPIMDKALHAMEVLNKQGNNDITDDLLHTVQSSVKQRVRTLNYHSEILSKLGISAVGNVNYAFAGAIQASRNYYGSPYADASTQVRSKIMTAIGYEAEQAAISSKKIELKAGNTRVSDLSEILNKIRDANGSIGSFDEEGSLASELYNWMSKNIDKGKTKAQFQNITAKRSIPKVDPSDTDAVLDFMYKEAIEGYADVYRNPTTRNSAIAYSKAITRKGSPEAIGYAQGMLKNNFLGETVEDITGVEGAVIPEGKKITGTTSSSADYSDGQRILRGIEQNGTDEAIAQIKRVSGKMKKWATADIKGSGAGKALAMGVLGLAGGLIASGYASGNPLNDANPEHVAQEQTNTRMSFGPDAPQMAPNNTGGYIINIKGDTNKGNRQLKRAMKQAANASVGGGVNINMSLKTSREGGYTDRDIENILSNYF